MQATLKALDDLITWYEIHKPDAGQRIEVLMSPTALGRLLHQMPRSGSREFEYRRRIIVAVSQDPVAARFVGGEL